MRSSLLFVLAATILAPIASASSALPRSFEQSFEQNSGQTSSEVKFLSRGPAGSVFVMDREIVLAPAEGKRTVRMKLPGSFSAAGVNHLPWKTNSLRRVSVTGVENYSELRLRSTDGLVLRLYYDTEGELTYEWHLAAGTRPEKVQWRMDGEDSLAIDPRGDLIIRAGDETIRQRRPMAYQESGNGRAEIPAAFPLTGKHEVGFAIDPYDRSKELVIDPTVYFANHPGAAGDHIWAQAVDSAGYSYITGITNSIDFPSATAGGGGLFVAKFSPDGSQLLYKAILNLGGASRGSQRTRAVAYTSQVTRGGSNSCRRRQIRSAHLLRYALRR